MPHSIINDFKKQAQNLHTLHPKCNAKKKKKKLKKIVKKIKKDLIQSASKENRRAVRKVKSLFIQYQFHWKIAAKWEANPIHFNSFKAKHAYLKKIEKKLRNKKSKKAQVKRKTLKKIFFEQLPNQCTKPSLQWTARKIDCIELAYALHTAKVFNHGKADLIEILKGIQRVVSININQPNRMFIDIQNRKKEQTKFLNELTSALLQRINENEAK